MLFNSYIFILAFLPVVLAGFYALSPLPLKWRIYWLILGSCVFYAWWNPPFLLLLISSILINYAIGTLIERVKSKWPLIMGIVFNLGVIGYYKYFWFFLSQFMSVEEIGASFSLASPLLPLGISFFTFQQIAYLVDRYQSKVVKHNLREYALFVSFFPQLIAGPIVHQSQMLPQLTRKKVTINSKYIALGAGFFILGLAKKTLLADPLGGIATPLFTQSLTESLSFTASWIAALSYTLQLYFDFSGYSDMAIGLAFLFGVKLPLNFFSPYKATNIIDFWRRWHMTLSRFLRDYLYIPLGGNRKGPARRYINLMITMLLGGLWHGAGWTFIIWGGLHGVFLCINHLWAKAGVKLPKVAAWAITFTAVVFAWVLFRAENLDSGLNIWRSMLLPSSDMMVSLGALKDLALICVGLAIALLLPNTYQWLVELKKLKISNLSLSWKPGIIQGAAFGAALFACLVFIQMSQSEFLYFNF
jgi:alginate O-acetyltransferase complex protein AlgI